MIETELMLLMGAFVGLCAYFCYKNGFRDGYQEMALEITSAIVEIHLEKEKVETMKLEVEQIQKECAKLMEESKV